MKILLIGEIYSSNLGDAIICDCVKYLVQNLYPNCEFKFYDTSARIDFCKEYNPTNIHVSYILYNRTLIYQGHTYSV